MRDLLERGSLGALEGVVDERSARTELRRQVGRLERELGALFGESFGHVGIDHRVAGATSAPRLLDLGELERIRDDLAVRVGEARRQLAARAQLESANRERLRALLESPADHRWVLITREEIGEPGCGGWHSRPRFGPIGMLLGWWRVKVSSGCPLPGRLAAVEREAQAARPAQGPGSEDRAGARPASGR